jgi:hypothetical protein
MFKSNSFFIKYFHILSEEPSQCRSVPAYTAPGESDHAQTKKGIPSSLGCSWVHSILLRRRKNRKCSELKMFGPCLRLHATTGSHLDDTSKHFSFLKSSSVSLFWTKKPKSRPQSTLFEFQYSNIFNDLLAMASEHKSEKFFCLQIFENIWNFNILRKKEFDSPLSYNCNL